MDLAQLNNTINNILQFVRHPEEIDVVITIRLPYATCGQRPCTGVHSVGMGFDWEDGQFRITPQEPLMCVKHDTPQIVQRGAEKIVHCKDCELSRQDSQGYCCDEFAPGYMLDGDDYCSLGRRKNDT